MRSFFAPFFLFTLLIKNPHTLKSADLANELIPQRLMGIEIETSVIKIMSPTPEKIGFNIGDEHMPNWVLEEDTLDPTFEKVAGSIEFDRNMELRSHYGKEIAAINQIATEIELVLSALYIQSIPQLEVNPPLLESVLLPHSVRVFPIDSACPSFLIKSKILSVKKRIIRPQVTYQLPLELIPRVFQRLQMLKHLGISQFLSDLTPREVSAEIQPVKATSGRLAEVFKIAAQNKEKGKPIRNYFKEHIATPYSLLPDSRAKGFLSLFLYYWYELFNAKEIAGVEPGLKQYLGVMSRIPLSQLHASLIKEEQDAFYEFMRNHLIFGDQCLLRPYYDYDDNLLNPIMTLTHWFASIIKEEGADSTTEKKADFLSPPPGLPKEYSMGFLDINSHASGLALIEARGYSSVKYNGEPLIIYQIRDFVNTESLWFFGY